MQVTGLPGFIRKSPVFGGFPGQNGLRSAEHCHATPDQEPFFQEVSRQGGWLMGMLVVIFILVSSLIVINMLIGVLVEAVQTVSDVEHEAIQIAFAKLILDKEQLGGGGGGW